jgi:hypothetical protein
MDVQLYLFINGAWQEYNPKPAVHNHTISEVTGLQAQLNSKLSASDVSAWAKKSSLDHGDIPYATSNTKGGVRVKVVGTSVYIYTTD